LELACDKSLLVSTFRILRLLIRYRKEKRRSCFGVGCGRDVEVVETRRRLDEPTGASVCLIDNECLFFGAIIADTKVLLGISQRKDVSNPVRIISNFTRVTREMAD
jgi:hypothetical protein